MTGGLPGYGRELVPAVGGTRLVPAPDEAAREYVVLALRLDQHAPGLVDGYYGPAALKAQVDLEQLRDPARLADDAAALRERVLRDVGEADRRAWLVAQLTALETQARGLAGAPLAYEEHVRRCFDWVPVRRDEQGFADAAAEIDALLPGKEPVADRLAAWDAAHTIPSERVAAVADWLVAEFRNRSASLVGMPDRETLRVALVRGAPWGAYNWYEGGRRSRVDINLDLPVRAADLVHTIGHETYPGHHLEHAWKEALLVDEAGRGEASILLINTPECLISEGLADVGPSLVLSAADDAAVLAELYPRAELPFARDAGAARESAAIDSALRAPRRRLGEARVNAALQRHADGATRDDVLAYLREVGRLPAERAAKALEFIEHPLWRTYVFVYYEGAALLTRWLDDVPIADRPARFARLLREQLTPTALAAELTEPKVRQGDVARRDPVIGPPSIRTR